MNLSLTEFLRQLSQNHLKILDYQRHRGIEIERTGIVDEKWIYVIFNDKINVVLNKRLNHYSVWRKSDEVWRPDYTGHSPRKKSTMFLDRFSYNGIGMLILVQCNSVKYVELLDQHLWPVIAEEFPKGGWIFQEDNCPVHLSMRTIHWKAENNTKTYVTEYVWRKIKVKRRKRLREI